jgi:hypothetical protein
MVPLSLVTLIASKVATFAEASAAARTETDMMTNHNTDFAWLKTDSDLKKIFADSDVGNQDCLSDTKLELPHLTLLHAVC